MFNGMKLGEKGDNKGNTRTCQHLATTRPCRNIA
jgi:hypothetical protein